MTTAARTTRLAPSPTGALHLGNARTFLLTWALARRRGWRILLRIEDLDGPRIKPGAAAEIASTLAWLGMEWDADVEFGAPEGVLVQSKDLSPYARAMQSLARAGVAYPCDLSRTEIEAAASAPHGPATDQATESATKPATGAWAEGRTQGQLPTGGEVVFPAALRPAGIGPREFDEPHSGWRLATAPGPVHFIDEVVGPVRIEPAKSIGDFVLWTKRGTPSYQLAVVVDDARQGITDVVRGDDLLDSAGRQLLLYRALGLTPEPAYWHLPLVRGSDGRRLAKRHGDTRVEAYRTAGVRPERVIGLCAFWSGLIEKRAECSARELVDLVDFRKLPRSPAVYLAEDETWLRSS